MHILIHFNVCALVMHLSHWFIPNGGRCDYEYPCMPQRSTSWFARCYPESQDLAASLAKLSGFRQVPFCSACLTVTSPSLQRLSPVFFPYCSHQSMHQCTENILNLKNKLQRPVSNCYMSAHLVHYKWYLYFQA